MREIISIILLFMLFNVGCSDSKNPTGSDNNENTTIDIQGVVMGPGNTSGKVLPLQGTNQQLSNKELKVQRSDTNPELIKKDEDVLEVPGSFQKAEGTSLSNESPLEDVIVSFYELDDYISNQESAQLIASTTTDTDGRYTITDLEEGIDMVIVAESVPRQTLMVMNVDQQSKGDVNSSTSIVSEYWAGELADGTDFNQSGYDELLDTANELLADMPTDELLSILSELVPERFGDGFPGNLSSEAKRFVNTLMGINLAACEDIAFSVQSARPGTFINLQNLPDDLGGDPFAWSYIEEEEEIYPVYVGALEDDRWELLVPMHPVNSIDGGNVKIFIESEDAQARCGDYNFEIEPLEPAPGTFESMVDEFENTAISISEMIGYSREELLSKNMNELDSYAAVMKSVLTLIGGPKYPGSLRYTLDNQSSNETLDIYDAILSELLGSDDMGKNIVSGDSEVTLFPDFNPCEIPLNGLASGSIFSPTPEDLDCWMNVNSVFEDFNENEFQTYKDIVRRSTPIISVFVLDPSGGEMVLSEVEGYLEFMEMMLASFEYLFPSELLGIDLEGNPILYNNEDDGTNGRWEASIYAQPKDWEFDILLAIGTLPVPGAGKGAGIISKLMRQSDDVQKVVEAYIDGVQDQIQGTGIGQYTFEAQVFGPIGIESPRDSEYFNWELNTKTQETNIDPFSFAQDKQVYTPKAVGISALRIETKGGDVFKGQNAFNEVDLEVVGINITLVEFVADSDTTYVSPIYIGVDEELTLEAAVENARNKEVAWSVSPEESGLSLTDWHVEPATGIKDVIAKDPGRYTVEVESIADTGPRADKNPRRFDWVTIVVGGLNVSNPGCLQPGETSQLKASIGGESVDFSELEWDINGPGSIDSDGVFTANETGTVEIDFYLSDYSEMTYSINFRIDETCRSFTLSSDEFEISGTCVYFDEYDTNVSNTTAIYFGTPFDDIYGSMTISTVLSNSMPADEAWTVTDPEWPISTTVKFKEVSERFPYSPWFHNAKDPPGPFTVTIEHNIENKNARTLSGSFKGEFEFGEYTDDEIIGRIETVEGSFRGVTRSVPNECF